MRTSLHAPCRCICHALHPGCSAFFFFLLALSSSAAKGSQQILPVASLRTLVGQGLDRVSVRGVITRTGRESFLQDATGGVLVHFAEPMRIKVGDELEVTGIPVPTPYSADLNDASARLLWAGTPPPPVAITVGQAARGDFDSQFVELEARVDRIQRRSGDLLSLSMSTNQQEFVAILQSAHGGFIPPHLEAHSMLRLRGICSMDPALTRDAVPFALLLRSAEDIEQLAGPPWWTPQLLFRDFLILLSLSLLTALIVFRVRNNRTRAIQRERDYIAHEIHDTLAQSFAGVGFQLQAVRSGIPPDAAQLNAHVDVAINMVRHSHQEARRSIAALKTRGSADLSVGTELMQSLQRMVGEGPMRISLTIQGAPRSLPMRINNTLLRVGQEAGANAISHSGASTLLLRLIYLDQAVMLETEDNGRGFDTGNVTNPGLGLTGMATRAQKLHGTLKITSLPEGGTTVSVLLPLRSRRRWQPLRSERNA